MGISSLPDFKGNIVKHMFDMQKPQMKIFTFQAHVLSEAPYYLASDAKKYSTSLSVPRGVNVDVRSSDGVYEWNILPLPR